MGKKIKHLGSVSRDFRTLFFHDSNRLKYFLLRFPIRLEVRSASAVWMTPWNQNFRLSDPPLFIIKSFPPWLIFSPIEGVHLMFLYKSNQLSFLIWLHGNQFDSIKQTLLCQLRLVTDSEVLYNTYINCGIRLRGIWHTTESDSMMHTAESDSAVGCTLRNLTLRNLTPRYDAHCGIWLCGEMHTAESDSAVGCTLRNFLNFNISER